MALELRGLSAPARRLTLAFGVLLVGLAGGARAQQMPVMPGAHGMSWGRESFVLLDQFEYAPLDGERPLGLEVVGWVGGAYNRVWFRLEGEQPTTASSGEGEAQLLYGRLVSPYWDALVGIRVDGRWGEEGSARALFAVGLEGLAPYWYEIAPTLFVSPSGDLSARLEASYEVLFTQRLVLEPQIEVNAAWQAVPELGLGSGFNSAEAGLRLRYEIRRELAPYVGLSRARYLGDTADLARGRGDPVAGTTWVVGVRLWR